MRRRHQVRAQRNRPSPRFASVVGQIATVAPPRATPALGVVEWVACTSVQRASTSALSSSHCTGAAAHGDAVVDLGTCSAMCVHRHRGGNVASTAASRRRHRAQAVEAGADVQALAGVLARCRAGRR
jgi:hypothetical protein